MNISIISRFKFQILSDGVMFFNPSINFSMNAFYIHFLAFWNILSFCSLLLQSYSIKYKSFYIEYFGTAQLD